MQPKTNHNYRFVVLLGAKKNIIQKHTQDVWSSSKFHNHSLVSGGFWVPLSWTSSLSFLKDACTRTHMQECIAYTPACNKCNTSSQVLVSMGQFALPACCGPGLHLFSLTLLQTYCFHSRAPADPRMRTALGYIVLRGLAAYARCEMQMLFILCDKANCGGIFVPVCDTFIFKW